MDLDTQQDTQIKTIIFQYSKTFIMCIILLGETKSARYSEVRVIPIPSIWSLPNNL